MPALQVRDMPDDLYGELKVCAKENNRSIAQQTIVILREYLAAQVEGEGEGEGAVDSVTQGGAGTFSLPVAGASSPYRDHLVGALEAIKARGVLANAADLPNPADLVRQGRDERFGLEAGEA